MTVFHKLNEDWNAQPNTPEPFIQISGSNLILSFFP